MLRDHPLPVGSPNAHLIPRDHFPNHPRPGCPGNDALVAVGEVLRQSLRESDFVGRYGGEEFLVPLPATGPDGAMTIAEKIRHAVGAIVIPGVDRRITVSTGVSVRPDHAVDADGLGPAADRALSVANDNRRNRIEVASSSGDAPVESEPSLAVPIDR